MLKRGHLVEINEQRLKLHYFKQRTKNCRQIRKRLHLPHVCLIFKMFITLIKNDKKRDLPPARSGERSALRFSLGDYKLAELVGSR